MVVLHSVVHGVVGNRLETDRLLREVDTWVKVIGHNDPLHFVVGDLNIELLDSQVLMEWAAGDVLHDLHVARAAKCGTLPGPTTDHRRIDYVWVNAPAREAVTDFSVEDILPLIAHFEYDFIWQLLLSRSSCGTNQLRSTRHHEFP